MEDHALWPALRSLHGCLTVSSARSRGQAEPMPAITTADPAAAAATPVQLEMNTRLNAECCQCEVPGAIDLITSSCSLLHSKFMSKGHTCCWGAKLIVHKDGNRQHHW